MSPSTPIRLVALDLDGTLLDSQSQISPRTRPLLVMLNKHNVLHKSLYTLHKNDE